MTYSLQFFSNLYSQISDLQIDMPLYCAQGQVLQYCYKVKHSTQHAVHADRLIGLNEIAYVTGVWC